MAYPKTTDETKMKFITDVIRQLEERGEQKKSECLRKHTTLQKLPLNIERIKSLISFD